MMRPRKGFLRANPTAAPVRPGFFGRRPGARPARPGGLGFRRMLRARGGLKGGMVGV